MDLRQTEVAMTALGETMRRREMWELRQKRARVRYQTIKAAEFYILLVVGFVVFLHRDRFSQMLYEVLFK